MRSGSGIVVPLRAGGPAMTAPTIRKSPRNPVRYSPELADEIVERISAGEALQEICRSPHMPDEKAVRKWVKNDAHGFGPRYAQAREDQAEHWAGEIITIADGVAGCT